MLADAGPTLNQYCLYCWGLLEVKQAESRRVDPVRDPAVSLGSPFKSNKPD